jgi:hypothetical protein
MCILARMGVDRYPNTNGYPNPCLCRKRQGKGYETEYSDNCKYAEQRFGALHDYYPLVAADRRSVFLLYISVPALIIHGCRGGHTVPVRLGTPDILLYIECPEAARRHISVWKITRKTSRWSEYRKVRLP